MPFTPYLKDILLLHNHKVQRAYEVFKKYSAFIFFIYRNMVFFTLVLWTYSILYHTTSHVACISQWYYKVKAELDITLFLFTPLPYLEYIFFFGGGGRHLVLRGTHSQFHFDCIGDWSRSLAPSPCLQPSGTHYRWLLIFRKTVWSSSLMISSESRLACWTNYSAQLLSWQWVHGLTHNIHILIMAKINEKYQFKCPVKYIACFFFINVFFYYYYYQECKGGESFPISQELQ